MRSIKSRWAIALLACLVLAIPASASAHPGVYEVTAKVAGSGCEYPTTGCLTDQTQYAISNDGWAMGYKEDNGLASGPGMVNYKILPGTWRTPMTPEQKLTYPAAQTDVQPHATCLATKLVEPVVILAWQSSDPFFAYIPWQKISAGLGDEPSKWIPVVKAATAGLPGAPAAGVDLSALSTEAEFKAACEALPGGTGQYHKADTASEIDKATAALKAQEAVAPFEAEVTSLLGEKSSLQAQIATWSAKSKGLEGEKSGLLGENEALKKQVGSLKRTNKKKSAQIKALRKRLAKAGHRA